MARLRTLHAVLGVTCFAFIALLIVANALSGCKPDFLVRPEVIAWIALAAGLGLVLLHAAAGDTDQHRLTGSLSSAAMTGMLLGTISIPVLAAPLALIGCFRLPRSRGLRLLLGVLALAALPAAIALPYATRALSSGAQGGCA